MEAVFDKREMARSTEDDDDAMILEEAVLLFLFFYRFLCISFSYATSSVALSERQELHLSELIYLAFYEDMGIVKLPPKSLFRIALSFPFKTISLPLWLASEGVQLHIGDLIFLSRIKMLRHTEPRCGHPATVSQNECPDVSVRVAD